MQNLVPPFMVWSKANKNPFLYMASPAIQNQTCQQNLTLKEKEYTMQGKSKPVGMATAA